jgi:gluconate 2-dehydrogenase gamma chain
MCALSVAPRAAGYNPNVLDHAQVALLSAIVERLIPTDAHGPGAREAHAAQYILDALASDYQRYLPEYVTGLTAIDSRAQATHGDAFVSLAPERQDAILAEFDRRDADPPTPRSFFDLVLKHTREGMFGDPRWGGNADRVGWALIGYGGPRFEWAAEDQRIECVEPDVFGAKTEPAGGQEVRYNPPS